MILEQIYCIRWFGAMSGRFNFSNLQQTKEGGVNRPTSTFSALASTIHVQGLHSHYNSSLPTHTNTHSLPLSCSGTTHSSVQCLSFPSASLSSGKHECLLWAEAQLKVCLHPAPPSLGWFFFRFFFSLSCCPQSWAPDKAFLSVRELQNQECGLDVYGQRNIQCFCSRCLLIIRRNGCAVSLALQLIFWSLCPPVDTHLGLTLSVSVQAQGGSLCAGSIQQTECHFQPVSLRNVLFVQLALWGHWWEMGAY